MNFKAILLLFSFCISLNAQVFDLKSFDTLNQSIRWKLEMKDNGTKNWHKNWFLDGLHAEIENSKKGMSFSAGKVEREDAYHAVLWTKKSFKGDIKLEFTYTRTDNKTTWANILYLHATGIGTPPHDTDISKWKQLREIPAMKTYFNNMKALHISFASFENTNTDKNKDYIRVRQYPVKAGENFNTTTEIPNPYFETDLFKTGETYIITIIKTQEKLFFKVTKKDSSKLFSWVLSHQLPLNEGRIGLRHMFSRSAIYKDICIYTSK